ncbi:GNAT family N-acetyltransferase [Candidatus Woesearchaeota archaeon]|nr:GNAT family N-acetyltransferase [Candidatus Woesearchaeota archaeon]
MKIREIKKEDRQKWIKLVQLTDNRNKEWAEQKLDSYLDSKKKKRLLIVEENGKLIGFVGIKGEDVEENVSEILNKEYVLITWIALIPKYRKKGLGSQILKECEKYARKWEKKGIWLGCKEKVIHFYEKNGYHKEGTFINDDGREEYLMLREIG